jgi:hypothetical protein
MIGFTEVAFFPFEAGWCSAILQAITPCLAGIYLQGHGVGTPPSLSSLR